MPQFFVDKKLTEGTEVEIRGSEAHHVLDVLRLHAGDWIVLSDGSGRSFRSTILATKAKALIARIGREINRPAGRTPPALAIATIKPDRLEWAVQKSVELGCRHIMTFVSERTARRQLSENSAARKSERLTRIAMAAAKQSGLPMRPELEAVRSFQDLCTRIPGFSPAVLLYEGESRKGLHDIWRKMPVEEKDSKAPLVIVGPEGGFTAAEVDQALASGALTASLGPQILRVETAAVAAVAICQYELGNMNAPSNAS